MNNANSKQQLMQVAEQNKAKLNAMTFGGFINTQTVKQKINAMLGQDRGLRFITGITSAVTTNSTLAQCTNDSIFNGALLGETLNLSPSPQLGQYYLVPFKDKEKGMVAQFQLGYKGYIQLAIRSGYYTKLNVVDIKQGELIKYDPLNEEINVQLIDDELVREQSETIGYYAMFEYKNGFRKSLYWSKTKMMEHAKKYSQGYKKDLVNGTSYTFWSKDFDGMAFKTMLRQLISKWGIMSVEMQKAFEGDMGVIGNNGEVDYIDNQIQEETIIEQKDGNIPEAQVTEQVSVQETEQVTEEIIPQVKKVTIDELRNNQ
ncbi:MAG: recombinase RecT [Treponema sp.]|nr:recombinase RecT [Treponema sp.]